MEGKSEKGLLARQSIGLLQCEQIERNFVIWATFEGERPLPHPLA